MTIPTYKRITSACFWFVIAAALLFDRVGAYSWVLGSLAAAAVLVAGSVHFYSLRHPAREDAPARSAAEADLPAITAEPQTEPLDELPVARVPSNFLYASHHFPNPGNILSPWYATRLIGVVSSGKRPRSALPVDDIVRIVRELSTSQTPVGYEFTLTPEGSLTIRSSSRHGSISEQLLGSPDEEAITPLLLSSKVH